MRLFLLLFCLISVSAKAVEFTAISKKGPVTLSHTAEFDTYVDISLRLDLSKSTAKKLYLRARYIIGADTLHDNLTVDGAFNGVVKQLLLKEGERVTAQLLINNVELESAEGMQGSFTAKTNTELRVGSDFGQSAFIGNVWLRDQNPLFRVKFDQAFPRDVKVVFDLNSNFEYDALHYKVKVISPEQGILFLPRTAVVTEEAVQSDRSRKLSLSLEGVNFSYPGSYYLQVMHAMAPERVNGVEKVSYEVVAQ